MKSFMGIIFSLLLIILTAECGKNHKSFKEEVTFFDKKALKLKYIKNKIQYLDSTFKNIADSSNSSYQEYGYFITDSILYFDNCLSSNGTRFLPANDCNLDSLLGEQKSKKLYETIRYLEKEGIRGCRYSQPLNCYTVSLFVDYKEYGDARYIFVLDQNSDRLNKTPYAVISIKEGLALLKIKDKNRANLPNVIGQTEKYLANM